MISSLRRTLGSQLKRRTPAVPKIGSPESLEQRQMLAADLTLTNVSISSITPEQPNVVHLTVPFSILNSGDQSIIANNVIVQAVLSPDNIKGNGNDVGAGGQAYDISLIPNTIHPGTLLSGVSRTDYEASNFLIIKVDNGDTVVEGNENNNLFVIALPKLPTLTTSQGITLGKSNKVIVVDPNLTFTDADTTTFQGSTLTTAVNADEGDTLSMKKFKSEIGTFRIKKGELLVGKTAIATVTGGTNADPLVMTFNTEVSAGVIQAIGRAITLKAKKGAVGDRPVQFLVKDADNVSSFIVTKGVTVS